MSAMVEYRAVIFKKGQIAALYSTMSDIVHTEKLKTKMMSFYRQQMVCSQIVSKKDKITILSFMKNSKNDNIIFKLLVFSISTKDTKERT